MIGQIVWLDKPKVSDPNALRAFVISLLFPISLSLRRRLVWLPVGKVTFACYSNSSKSSLICTAFEQYKLEQVLNSNLISEWLCSRKLKWKRSHLKILNALHVIETLTKLLHCSVEANMFSLWDTTASPTHSSYLQYNLKLWSSAFQTRTTTSSFACFTRNNQYDSANTGRS